MDTQTKTLGHYYSAGTQTKTLGHYYSFDTKPRHLDNITVQTLKPRHLDTITVWTLKPRQLDTITAKTLKLRHMETISMWTLKPRHLDTITVWTLKLRHLEEDCPVKTFFQKQKILKFFSQWTNNIQEFNMQPLKALKPFEFTRALNKQPPNLPMLLIPLQKNLRILKFQK